MNSARIWPSPGVAISSARHDTGTWPSTSGAPRTRRLPPAEVRDATLEPGHREVGDRPHRGPGEHQPADRVEVAGEHVDDVDQPARERAELLVAQADAAVDDGALGRREVAGERADAVGVDAGDRRDPLRRPVGDERLDLVDAVEQVGDVAEPNESLG